MKTALRATFLALAALAAANAAFAQSPASTPPKPARLALVIGNGAYKDAALANPVNDAADMAKALEASGFTVMKRENASLREMHLALREFGDRLGRQSTGLVYFAGHGVQVRGRNYLLPVDADIQREDEVAFSALDVGAVMEKLDSARNPVNIVILDACRDNPFGSRFQMSSKGLAQVEAPPGTLIAFSTAPGSAAADGAGRNGLYTGHLLAEMKKPGAAIEETFRSVRAAVRRDSKGLQVPWESTSLESEFKFFPAVEKPQVMASALPSPASGPGKATRRYTSFTVPPTFVAGDGWVYKVTNMLDNTQGRRNLRVLDVKGEQVTWSNDAVGDLLGNWTRVKIQGQLHTFSPSTQHFVFPLRSAAAYDVAFVQEAGKRIYDGKVRLTVGQEEDIATPAGKFHAIKVTREVKWKERRRDYGGTNVWTYWYSPEAKRFVRGENTNTTTAGKLILHEQWELEKYNVR